MSGEMSFLNRASYSIELTKSILDCMNTQNYLIIYYNFILKAKLHSGDDSLPCQYFFQHMMYFAT